MSNCVTKTKWLRSPPPKKKKSVIGQSVLSLQDMAAISQFLKADGQAADTSVRGVAGTIYV